MPDTSSSKQAHPRASNNHLWLLRQCSKFAAQQPSREPTIVFGSKEWVVAAACDARKAVEARQLVEGVQAAPADAPAAALPTKPAGACADDARHAANAAAAVGHAAACADAATAIAAAAGQAANAGGVGGWFSCHSHRSRRRSDGRCRSRGRQHHIITVITIISAAPTLLQLHLLALVITVLSVALPALQLHELNVLLPGRPLLQQRRTAAAIARLRAGAGAAGICAGLLLLVLPCHAGIPCLLIGQVCCVVCIWLHILVAL